MMKENTFSSKEVGHFIYKRRKELHYTQKDLADMLYVTDRAVSKWERGNSVPDIATLLQLSRILKVDVDVILNGGNHSTVSNSAMGWQYYFEKLFQKKECAFLLLFLYLGVIFFTYFVVRYHSVMDFNRYFSLLGQRFNWLPFLDFFDYLLHPTNFVLLGSILQNIIINVTIMIPISILCLWIDRSKRHYFIFIIEIVFFMEIIKWFSLLGIFDVTDILLRLFTSFVIMKLGNRKERKK